MTFVSAGLTSIKFVLSEKKSKIAKQQDDMLLFTFYRRSEIFMVWYEKIEDSNGIFRNRFEGQILHWKNTIIQTMVCKSLRRKLKIEQHEHLQPPNPLQKKKTDDP